MSLRFQQLRGIFYKLTHWEEWNYLAKYIPISPVWLWHCLRARSLWFFTPSNPSLHFGGFEGEGKREMYEQLPMGTYPKSDFIIPSLSFAEVEARVHTNNFHYPFVVKPNVGMMGLMFRCINNSKGLAHYHSKISVEYIIQELVTYPLEVSVFYYRYPYSLTGTITGFIKKELLEVVGNGYSTLLELMLNYPRVQFRLDEMKSKHANMLDVVLPEGGKYILSQALNLSRGGQLVSLEHQKDNQLLAVFDRLSLYTKTFFYGRYDIKCQSIEDLKKGEHYSILEYNGCGAEPHHIYGNGNTLIQAYAIVLKHWKVLARISSYNQRQGIKCWQFKKGWNFLKDTKQHFKRLKQLDKEFPMINSNS